MKKLILTAILMTSTAVSANTCTRADLTGSYVSMFSSFGGGDE